MKIDGIEVHSSLTEEIILDAVRRETFGLDNPGFCLVCGEERDGCEPDARAYPCESCGLRAVYGAEEIMLHLVA